MENRITAIIQARMASTRLPGKVMLPLNGSPVLEHIIRRVRLSEHVNDIVIATTFDKSDDIIAELAGRLDVDVFRGSGDDVLGRVTQAAHRGSSEWIIRVTGDNPFVDPRLLDHISVYLGEKHDYVSNKIERTWPTGIDADGFSVLSLAEACETTENPIDREHITSYYIRNQSNFHTHNILLRDVYGGTIDENESDIRFTLDEALDYLTFEKICSDIENPMDVDTNTLVQYVRQHPDKIMNASINQRTSY
jgi:spore coat polysaccharide biosynthesis protein SpsF